MGTRSRSALLVSICLLLGGVCGPVRGQALLKPQGATAENLRTRSLDADVSIHGQFASTRLLVTYHNETADRIEAEFMYAAPSGAVVTGFAYWYGSEKVVARVVEKERAAEIYRAITTRLRDPALVELVGRNVLRARIFPVMPNQDLKVEVKYVEALPATPQGPRYTLPLERTTLESCRIGVWVGASPGVVGATNSLGLPIEERPSLTPAGEGPPGYWMRLSTSNYAPPGDLRVLVRRKAAPLAAVLYSARSGGRDGFFALAITPSRPVRQPRVAIRGVQTYDVLPSGGAAGPRRALFLYGRYRGEGQAAVELTGQTDGGPVRLETPVRFAARAVPQNLATKLWAARRIERLSALPGRRPGVVALSLQYTLPSRYTSWLAVPRDEMARYVREKAENDFYDVSRQLTDEIVAGRAEGRRAQFLHRRLLQLARVTRLSRADTIGWAVYELMSRIGAEYVATGMQPHPSTRRLAALRGRLDRLAPLTGRPVAHWITEGRRLWASEEAERVRARLIGELRKPRQDAGLVRTLQDRLARLYGWPGTDNWQTSFARTRVERLTARTELEQLDAQLQHASPAELEALRRKREALDARHRQLVARMGDPLIQVDAPADARQVVALMPDATVKPLLYNADTRRWEARFDIAAYTPEGQYAITVVIVLPDGSRRTLRIGYRVDVTAPKGTASATSVHEPGQALRLTLEGDADTARVEALMPWGEVVALAAGVTPGHFFGVAAVPATHRGRPMAVTYVLTDRAHNRTTVTVEAR